MNKSSGTLQAAACLLRSKFAVSFAFLLMTPVMVFAQAACTTSEMTTHTPVYYEDFGTGGARISDPNVVNHSFQPFGNVEDDFYSVGRSFELSGFWMKTNGNVDADGNQNGRYLGINMRGKNELPLPIWLGEFYRHDNISLTGGSLPAGASIGGFRFSTALNGTCNGCADVPNFTLLLEDGSTGATLATKTSTALGVANDGVWRTVSLDVIPISTASANIVLFNSQPNGVDGNDVGIDNISLAPLVCVPPELAFSKTAVVDNTVAGTASYTEVGDKVTYTFTLENTGTTTAYNVALSETSFTGTANLPTPTVTSGAADLDGGDGTATDIAPGGTLVFTAEYTVTQADIDAVTVDNQATAAFEDLAGTAFSTLSDGDSGTSGEQVTTATLTSAPVPAPVPFPNGPGLAASVCNASTPSNAYGDIGIRWEYNGGDSPTNDRADLFENVSGTSVVGLNSTLSGSDRSIRFSTVPSAYNAGSYLQYSFKVRSDVTDSVELYGVSNAIYGLENPGDNQATGSYRYAVLVDDDPSFGSPEVLMSDVALDNNSIAGADVVFGPNNSNNNTFRLVHRNATGTTVELTPGQTYTTRVYFYDAVQAGQDSSNAFGGDLILWDDFLLKAVSCTPSTPELDVAKSVTNVGALQADGTFDVTYAVTVANSGNVTLDPLTLVDDLTAGTQLGAAFGSVVSAPVVSNGTISAGSTVPTANAGYNGTDGLITSSGVLIPGDSFVVTFTVNVDPTAAGAPASLRNTATAGGLPPGGVAGTDEVSDASDTDTDAAGDPDTTPNVGGGPGDPTVVTPPAAPVIILTKSIGSVADSNGNGVLGDAGDRVVYSFNVANVGPVDLVNVTVADTFATISGSITSLQAGQVDGTTITGEHYLTPDDMATGFVENTATVSGTLVDENGVPLMTSAGTPYVISDISDTGTEPTLDSSSRPVVVSNPEVIETLGGNNAGDGELGNDPTVLNLQPAEPTLALTKSIVSVADVNDNGLIDTDDIVTYAFAVTNTGTTSLADIRIDDAKLGLVDAAVTPSDLAPGGIGVLSGETYRIQDADMLAGGVENTAFVSGQPVVTGANNVPDPNSPLVDAVGNDLAEVTDTSDSGTGPELNSNGAPVVIAAHETSETPDLEGNTDGNPGNDPTILKIAIPQISLIKSVSSVLDTNGDGLFGGEGDEVSYNFNIHNTGNVDLVNITIADALLPVSGGPINLAVGAGDSTSFTATYLVQAPDVNRGYIENTASATGEAVDGAGNTLFGPNGAAITVSDISDAGTQGREVAVVDPEATETSDGMDGIDHDPTNDPTVQLLPSNAHPAVTLVKSVSAIADTNGSGLLDAGDTVTYAFSVTNTGNVRLADVLIDDPRANPVSGGPVSLDTGETDNTTFTATAIISSAEASNGVIENTAVVTGNAVNSANAPINDRDTGLPLTATDVSDAGTGAGIGIDGMPAVIPDPAGADTLDDPTKLFLTMPQLVLEKSVANVEDTNGSAAVDAGDVVTYVFAVTNTGNTDLANIAVTDDLPGLSFTVSPTIGFLAQGALNETISAQYTLTSADIGAGFVENTAAINGTAVTEGGTPFGDPFNPGSTLTVNDTSDAGTDPDGATIANPSGLETPDGSGAFDGEAGNDPTVLLITPSAKLTLNKSISSILDSNGNGLLDTGDRISYAFSVINTGNVALADVTISDPLAAVSGGPINLGIGDNDSAAFTAMYLVTDADVTAGFVENTATATGKAVDGAGNAITDPANPGVQLSASDVSDTGTSPDLDNTGTPFSVAGSEAIETPDGAGLGDGDTGNDPTVLNIVRPELSLVKTVKNVFDSNGDGLFGGEDDQIVYKFVLHNTGNTNLKNITVDDALSPVVGGPVDLLVGAGDSHSFTATHIVTAADITRGFVENTASASGEVVDNNGDPVFGPNGTPITVSDLSDAGTTGPQITVKDPENTETADGSGSTDGDPSNDPTVQTVPSNVTPSLTLVKSVANLVDTNGSGVVDAGDTVTYSFKVANSGNVRLGNVTIDDPRATSLSGGPITLEIGQTDITAFLATAVITDAEATGGQIKNVATVTGTAINSSGDPINDPETGLPLTVADVSDTGTEAQIGTSGAPDAVLDPEGSGEGGDDPTILSLPMPEIAVVKSVASVADTNGTGAVDAGDTVSYQFAVTNLGNTDLSDITVTDALTGLTYTSANTIAALTQGETDTAIMADYRLTDADVIAGFVENTANVTGVAVGADGAILGDPFAPGTSLVVAAVSDAGTSPDGETVTDPFGEETLDGNGQSDGNPANDPTVIKIAPTPEITLIKSISSVEDNNGNGLTDAGDVVNYAFGLTNTGNVDLGDVRVTDVMVDVVGASVALAIGATDTTSFAASYTITAADVAVGGIENTARAFGTAIDADGNVIDNPHNIGSPFEATDISDSGTQSDHGDAGYPVSIVDPNGTETANLAGETDSVPDNDPTVLVIARPEITLIKSVANVFDTNEDGLFGGEGDEVVYSFIVRNTGNVDLNNVVVSDALAVVRGEAIKLAAGEASSTTFSASYIATAADLARGYVENSARVSGDAVNGRGDPINGLNGEPLRATDISDAGSTGQHEEVIDPANEETPDGEGNTDTDPTNDPTVQLLPSNRYPSLRVVKSVREVADTNGSGRIDAGDMVTYGFAVTNNGNVRLADITIEDARAPVSGGPITLDLDHADTTTFTATAVITEAEAEAAAIINTATATGVAVNSAGEPFSDSITGEPIVATDVSDTGTEPQIGTDGTPVVIDDPEADGGEDPTTLALISPAIELRKSVLLVDDTNNDGLFGSTNDVIHYTFSITNTGNTTLSEVVVTDVNADISGEPITLAPGGTNTTAFTGTHLIIGTEFATGFVENTANATGTAVDADGNVVRGIDGDPVLVTDTSDSGTDAAGDVIADANTVESPTGAGEIDLDPTNDPTVINIPTNPEPLIQLVKSVDSVADTNEDAVQGGVEDVITYSFAVTNVGNTALSEVVINDPLLGGEIGTIAALAIDETQTLFGHYTIVAADEVAGFFANTAIATGVSVNSAGDALIDPDTGVQFSTTSVSDAGTARDATVIPDSQTVETPDGVGETDDDSTNDPTVINVPLTPSGASIAGVVYLDNDRDGIFDVLGDTRLENYQIVLSTSDNGIVAQTVSDSLGEYLLEGFGIGENYHLDFIDPDTNEVVGTIRNLNFERNTVLTDQDQEVVQELPDTILALEKTTELTNVIVGQTVPYEITVSNFGTVDVQNVSVVDRLPPGLLYTPGSATVNSVALEPVIAGSRLTWAGLVVAEGADAVVITLNARVSTSAALGELTNIASTEDTLTGESLSGTATAAVILKPEAVFDCSDIIGKVFDDRNANGYQDDLSARLRRRDDPVNRSILNGRLANAPDLGEEPGLANVRLVTQTGSIITTDEFGRYSVPCAELPGEFGANFSLKLDERSLPSGYRVTTENPRSMRVTAGIMTEMNFGASISRVLNVDLTAAAFNPGSTEPSDQLISGLEYLLQQVVDTPSVMRISYFHVGEDKRLIRARSEAVEKLVRKKWKKMGRYKLIFERTTKRMQ